MEGTAATGRRESGRCGGGQQGRWVRRERGRGTPSRSGRHFSQPAECQEGARQGASGASRVTREATAAGCEAGRPFPSCAPGGAGFACSWLSPPRESTAGRAGGETRSPVRRRIAERAPRAWRNSARGAGRGGPGALGAGRGGDSCARATLASYAYKSGVAEEGRRGPAGGRLSSPKELTFCRTRATSRRLRSPGPRRREEGAEEGGDCRAWPRKAHILGRAAVTRRGLTLHE